MGELKERPEMTHIESNDENIFWVDKYISGTGNNKVYESSKLKELELVEIIKNRIGGSGGGLIEVSKPDLDNLISDSELEVGATYKITGVHKEHTVNGVQVPALYDDGRGLGTTIFLKAVSENKLESFGSGLFYNPKYDLNTAGFGIWTNKVFVALSNVSGDFQFYHQDMDDNYGEPVTANNGAVGRILSKGQIVYVSGDWANVTSITGDISGSTADIDSVSVPSYNVNDVVFWGGYAWKNLNGNVGSSDDVLTLDSEWEKLDYTDSNYYNEVVVDYIEYDIDNDIITRRRNEEYNIDVNEVADIFLNSNSYGIRYSSISVMNYGMGFNLTAFPGITRVKVDNSYAELVNFRGERCTDVNLDNGGSLRDATFDNFSQLHKVNFNGGSLFQVNLNNSLLHNINFTRNGRLEAVNFDNKSGLFNVKFINGGSLRFTNFDNYSRLQGVSLNSYSTLIYTNFDNYSRLQGVSLNSYSTLIYTNFDNDSYLEDVNFDNESGLQAVNFDNESGLAYVNFDGFTISQLAPTTLLDNNKIIRCTDFKGVRDVALPLPDLSSATIIFNNNRKEVIQIQGATNNCKLITYDTSGNRVVNDITD